MSEWADKIRSGDARSLARAATALENQDPAGAGLLRELAPFAGHARIVGITGPPGAGKSTLVDALALALRRAGKTVAILAVDPSSRITGGAILGDRIRMQQHHADPGIFIRSMATRGSPGGLARATRALSLLMDSAGRDYVLIETVGVGQDEIDVAALAQVTVVVLVPGMGDDVQAIKAGIMEIAGIFVINKADQPGADRMEQELQAMLSLSAAPAPPILRTVATQGQGISELIAAIDASAAPRAFSPAAAPVLDHIGIAVPTLEPAIAFYQGLGLAVRLRQSIAAEKVNIAVLPAGQSRIELLEPSAPDSPIARFLAGRGPGLHHVALRVPDLAAALQYLAESGARVLGEPGTGAGGHTYVFVHPASTGGVLLELIQSEDLA